MYMRVPLKPLRLGVLDSEIYVLYCCLPRTRAMK